MTIRDTINTSTRNAMSLIKYPCGLVALKAQIAEHRSCIWSQDKSNPGPVHFREANRPVASLMNICIKHVRFVRRGVCNSVRLTLLQEVSKIYIKVKTAKKVKT